MIKKIYNSIGLLGQNIVASALCTVIYYFLYFLICYISHDKLYLLADFLGYAISFTILFIWEMNIFNYKAYNTKDKMLLIIKFIIFRAIGFVFDALLLSLLFKVLSLPNFIAKVTSSVIVFIYNYFINKLVVFKNRKD